MPTTQRRSDAAPSSANVAAIDFGTTYCSLAFKTAGDSGVTVVRLDGTDRRVPNAILLKVLDKEFVCTICKRKTCLNEQNCADDYAEQHEEGAVDAVPRRTLKFYNCKVNSFGYVAQRNYQTVRRNQYESHIYFERVKLELMQKEVIDIDNKVN